MADMTNLIKMGVDAFHGVAPANYSVSDSTETLREALIEMNGGSTKLDYKKIRDGQCNGMFTLVEEILKRTIPEGLQDSDFFNALVEFRNMAEGDQNVFEVEDNNWYLIAKAADGTQGIRRQRLSGISEVTIPTELRVVKIYEEMNRILSGRADFNQMIADVTKSFRQQLLNDIYGCWANATATDFGGTTYFPAAGTYSEDALLEVIAHVEAASGGQAAKILGTKKALRKLSPSIQSDGYKDAMYNNGYAGKFFGSDVVVIPQRHKVGSTSFVMPDDTITVIAGETTPIKCVYEGQSIMSMGNFMNNADLTQDYFYGEKYGIGLLMTGGNEGIGKYQFT